VEALAARVSLLSSAVPGAWAAPANASASAPAGQQQQQQNGAAPVSDAIDTLRSLCAGHEGNTRRLAAAGGADAAQAALFGPGAHDAACFEAAADLLADLAAAAAPDDGVEAEDGRALRACAALVGVLERRESLCDARRRALLGALWRVCRALAPGEVREGALWRGVLPAAAEALAVLGPEVRV
jgi:hypothetical protein